MRYLRDTAYAMALSCILPSVVDAQTHYEVYSGKVFDVRNSSLIDNYFRAIVRIDGSFLHTIRCNGKEKADELEKHLKEGSTFQITIKDGLAPVILACLEQFESINGKPVKIDQK